MHSLIPLIAMAILAANVAAHGTFHSLAERDAYQSHHKQARRALQQKCGETVKARRVRRAIARAAADEPTHPALKARFYDSVVERASNASGACVLDPEVTQGPYHVLGELYRQNITENQLGIPITYEFSFVDVESCEPLKGAWVDVWHANATGIYSGFIQASAAAGGGGSNSSAPSGSMSSGSALPSGSASSSGSMGAAPTGGMGGDGGGIITSATDNESFLRGIWRTDDDGLLTMNGVVPGWYAGRAVHTHLKVYGADQGEIADNGTFVAKTGAYHTGQTFFADEFIKLISTVEPYSLNRLSYDESTKNTEDSIFASENSDGNDAVMDLEYDANNLAAGIIATTYIGVNTSYVSQESAISYWAGNSSDSTNSSSSSSSTASASTDVQDSTSASQSNSARRNVPGVSRLFGLI